MKNMSAFYSLFWITVSIDTINVSFGGRSGTDYPQRYLLGQALIIPLGVFWDRSILTYNFKNVKCQVYL